MKPPITHSSEIVYEGFFKMRKDKLVRHDGEMCDFTTVQIDWDASVVIAEDPAGRLILNREYRHAAGIFVFGCPGGKLEDGEDPIDCGRRELLEESGYEANDLTLLGNCYPIPGVCNQKVYIIHGKNARLSSKKEHDPFEFIETVLLTEAELMQEIQKGAQIDGILCAALWYKSTLRTQ